MGSSIGSDVEAGFAKLQGEDFEYYMQTYSIILGRSSKKSTVDVDLSSLGGGMNISRHHARIFYDFNRRRFALEVLGKNGCYVEGVLHLPGNPPVKLDSQDLLQIGDKEFYFLLPLRSILGGAVGPRHHVNVNYSTPPLHQPVLPPPGPVSGYGKKGLVRGRDYYEEEEQEDDDEEMEEEEDDDDEAEEDINGGGGGGIGPKKARRIDGVGASSGGGGGYGYGLPGRASISGQSVGTDRKVEGRSRVDREADNKKLLELEEKDVVTCVANVLSDLCGPAEWMPMEKLHSKLMEQYGNLWHHSRVRRYLSCDEDYMSSEGMSKPWYGLLMLLRKFPEHFVINTRSKGRLTLEFVSLVSLIS